MPEAGWNQNASLWLASCYMSFLPRATSPELLSLGIGLSLHVCPSLFEGYIYSPINFGDWYWLVRCQAMQDSTRSARFSGWKPSTWNESDRILARCKLLCGKEQWIETESTTTTLLRVESMIHSRERGKPCRTNRLRKERSDIQPSCMRFWIYRLHEHITDHTPSSTQMPIRTKEARFALDIANTILLNLSQSDSCFLLEWPMTRVRWDMVTMASRSSHSSHHFTPQVQGCDVEEMWQNHPNEEVQHKCYYPCLHAHFRSSKSMLSSSATAATNLYQGHCHHGHHSSHLS